MRYYKVKCGNGYCGCDEEFLTECDGELEFMDILEMYCYTDGAAGLNPMDLDSEDFDPDDDISYDEYLEGIADNTSLEEIDEEEFIRLRDEEGWEAR